MDYRALKGSASVWFSLANGGLCGLRSRAMQADDATQRTVVRLVLGRERTLGGLSGFSALALWLRSRLWLLIASSSGTASGCGPPRAFRGLMRWDSYVADAAQYVGRNRSCTASAGVSRGARRIRSPVLWSLAIEHSRSHLCRSRTKCHRQRLP